MDSLRVIVTGSASFDLAGKVVEPLTVRKITRILYPIAQIERGAFHSRHDLKEKLADHLVFGAYPEIVIQKSLHDQMEYLNQIGDSTGH